MQQQALITDTKTHKAAAENCTFSESKAPCKPHGSNSPLPHNPFQIPDPRAAPRCSCPQVLEERPLLAARPNLQAAESMSPPKSGQRSSAGIIPSSWWPALNEGMGHAWSPLHPNKGMGHTWTPPSPRCCLQCPLVPSCPTATPTPSANTPLGLKMWGGCKSCYKEPRALRRAFM